MELELSVIVAATETGVIGRNGVMPWHIPSDLARFREITTAIGTMIMGRATYHTIVSGRGGKPLPDRFHVVLTRQWVRRCNRVHSAASVEEAMRIALERGPRACVIGGGQVYRAFLPLPQVKRVFLTTVHADIEGDVSFPPMPGEWTCEEVAGPAKWSPKDEYPTTFTEYSRIA